MNTTATGLFLRCIAIVLLAATVAGAQTTTQKTKPSPIGPTGQTAKPPRPDAPNVDVQHTITVDAKTGEVKLKAKFTNKDGNAKKFIFCQMVGMKAAGAKTTHACDLYYDAVAKEVKCSTAAGTMSSHNDTYHFGCKEVSLAGNGSAEADYGSSGAQPGYVGKKASDFYVTYADYVELPAGASFNAAGCGSCFGLGVSTGLDGTQFPEMMGDWYLPVLPFDDPFIRYQSITPGPVFVPEYRSFALQLGMPSNFPAVVTQLPRNIPAPVPPVYTVPLNLYDVHTMEAAPGEIFEAQLSVSTTGPGVAGSAFMVNPTPGETFIIEGGTEPEGTISVATPGALAEGSWVDLEILVREPDNDDGDPGLAYFVQRGRFIQDAFPPAVTSHTVERNPESGLNVSITANDATTTPLAASFWYSLDGGTSWNVEGMESTTSLFDDPLIRTFEGQAPGVADGDAVKYFFMVQDAVFNMTYYGVGELAAQPSGVDRGNSAAFSVRHHADRAGEFVVELTLPRADRVVARLHDMTGRPVATLVDGELAGGEHRLVAPTMEFASGTYLLSVAGGSGVFTDRVVIVK